MSHHVVQLCLCSAGERQREAVLQTVAANLEAWTRQVKREKAVYHTLNKLSVDVTRKVLVAEAWCPVSGIPRVQQALQQATQRTSGAVSATRFFSQGLQVSFAFRSSWWQDLCAVFRSHTLMSGIRSAVCCPARRIFFLVWNSAAAAAALLLPFDPQTPGGRIM